MIVITPEMAIKADKVSFMICKKIKPSKSAPDGWQAELFFATPEAMLRKLVDMAFAAGIQAGDWDMVAVQLKETKALIDDISTKLQEVTK